MTHSGGKEHEVVDRQADALGSMMTLRLKLTESQKEVERLTAEVTRLKTVEDDKRLRAAPILTAEINALPDRVRRYIHDLETNADPAGTIQDLAACEENTEILTAEEARCCCAIHPAARTRPSGNKENRACAAWPRATGTDLGCQ